MSELEIETDESGKSEETRETMRRCDMINQAICALTGPVSQPNDMAMWANAMTIVAGALIGMIHYQTGIAEESDQQVADAIRCNFLHGVGIGRAESAMGRKPH